MAKKLRIVSWIVLTLFGFLLLFSASAQAMNIMPSHSGSW